MINCQRLTPKKIKIEPLGNDGYATNQLTINQPLEKMPWVIGTMDDLAFTHDKWWKFCFLWKKDRDDVAIFCYDENISEEKFLIEERKVLKEHKFMSALKTINKTVQGKPFLIYNCERDLS
jgi:hypothetical protein